MRIIEIPKQEITLHTATGEPIDGEKPISFARYVQEILLTDPACGQGYDAVLAVAEITQLLKEANGTMKLSGAQWKVLTNPVNEPRTPRNPALMAQLLPFAAAIRNATPTTGEG